MTNVVAIIPLLLFAAHGSGEDSVNISLFSLFKSETLHVRVASGDGAILETTGLAGTHLIARGEVIRFRLSGSQLNILTGGIPGGAKQSNATGARILPTSSTTLELILPGRIKRKVRGIVSVDGGRSGRGPLRIVLATDRESAVASVVAAETSRREAEALKALAVVVRTFILSHARRHSSEGFDFCDTTHCQLYRGEQDFSHLAASPVAHAVAQTAGQFLSYQGRPVEGHYTASCGGISATPTMVWGGGTSYPYARILCRWCQTSRFSRWERSANARDVLKALSEFTTSKLSPATELISDYDKPSGFVRSVILRDGSKRTSLSADAFRRAIGLRLGWNTVLSPTFTVERRGTRFIFRGRGFGSQVGMCEAGAVAQAAAGRSYREIVRFYYPAADISGQSAHE